MGLFVRWWLEQLADLVPRRLVALFRRPPDAILIEQDQAGGTISVRRKGRVDATKRLAPGAKIGAETLLRGLGRLPPLTLLRPAVASILRKRVRLPAAASGNLRQLLAYEIERETPFSAGELYWDYRLRRDAVQEAQIEIDLILVPRDRVAPLVAVAAEAGLDPLALEVPGEVVGDDSDLLRIQLGDDPVHRPRDRSLLVLAGVTAGLVVLAIAAPLVRQSLAIAKAEAAFDAAKAEAGTAAKLRQEFDQLANTADFIAAERARAGSPLQAVAAATRLFPDDTYLTAFNLDGNRLAMTGFSQDAASLIARLAGAAELRDPAFTGPVTRAAGSNLEAFAIGVTLASPVAQ
jgi:general secretion pathway protein L